MYKTHLETGRSSIYSYHCTRSVSAIQAYVILRPEPLYQRGNLQDAINANVINHSQFPEKEMLYLFKGTCEAIRAMHDYRAPIGTSTDPFASRQNQSQHASTNHRRLSGEIGGRPATHGDDEEEDEDELFPHPEGDGDGGYSYHGSGAGRSAVPLVTKLRPEDEGETIYDGDEELSRIQREGASNAHSGDTEVVPYAHRDMKPG